MTNTIRLKITCFLLLFTVLLIKDILDLAWHLATRMKFGTWEQNWDLYGTISGLWSQLGPSPKFGTSLVALHCTSEQARSVIQIDHTLVSVTCNPQAARELITDFFLNFQGAEAMTGNDTCLQFQVKARSKSWWQTKFNFFLNTSDLEKLKSWLQGWKAKTWEENRIIRLVVPPTEEALRHIVHGIREKYSLTSAQTSARQMVDLPNIQNVTSFSYQLLNIPPGVLQSIEVIGCPPPKFGQPLVDLICSGMVQLPNYQSYIKETKSERGMEPYDTCAMIVSSLADRYEPNM